MYISDNIVSIILLLILSICGICIFFVKKKNYFYIDEKFALVGFILGIIITLFNLKFSNIFTITIGPLMTIVCIIYLYLRNRFVVSDLNFEINLNNYTIKVLNIFFWLMLLISVIIIYQSEPNFRPGIFFVFISLNIVIVSILIMALKDFYGTKILGLVIKIIILAILLRGSAFFVSPYPIGPDGFGHSEYINQFLNYHKLAVDVYPLGTAVDNYYINFPISHILSVISIILLNLEIKQGMFLITVISVIGSLFIYLIIKEVFNNNRLALLGMLFFVISDFATQWSIWIMPMAFGIVLYSIALYLVLHKRNSAISFLMISILGTLVWTHTVGSFVMLISLIALFMGGYAYKYISKEEIDNKAIPITWELCTAFLVIILLHWMDRNYPFFDAIIYGLKRVIYESAGFLTGSTSAFSHNWLSVLQMVGFLGYIAFGIFGILLMMTERFRNKISFQLSFMVVILFFISLHFIRLSLSTK